MIKALEHVALSVTDLDRSIAFYRDILGFELKKMIEPDPALRLDRVVGMPDAIARIAHLELGGQMLELFQYLVPEGNPVPQEFKQADRGFIHIGLKSDDARTDFKHLTRAGVKVYSDPIEFRPGVWLFYFYGPDGETCELRET